MKRLSILVLGAMLPLLTAAAGDLRLVGTMMMETGVGEPSHAVFETDDHRQLIVDLGEEIGGCLLVDVGARQVQMDCAEGGVLLVLRSKLRAASQDLPSAPPRYDISLPLADFERAVGDRQRLVSQISLEPSVHDGYLQGYRVAWLLPGGDFHRLGLQDGDVILSLNGVAASDPGTFMQTINALRGQPNFDLLVERSGQPVAYSYTLR
ncbi:MAG: hypothetical protein WBN65_15985 [Gammaproteobacteria bacterium]